MRKIDDTKRTIGAANLNEIERKKLFKNLTEAGGQVVDDPYTKSKSAKHGIIDREKQKEYKKQIDAHRRNAKTESVRKSEKRSASRSSSRNTLGFFSNLKLNLRLRLLRICKKDHSFFHDKFIKDLYGDYRTAFLEAKLQYSDIFRKNIADGKKITAQLDAQNPILFQLIETIEEIDDIPDVNTEGINTYELQQPLMEIFKTLLVLQPYENTLLNAYIKSIDLCRNRNTKRYPSQQNQKKMIKESLYIIFGKLYPRLHWLMCYYYACYIHQRDIKAMEELLGVTPIEKSGNIRAAGKTAGNPKVEKQFKTAEEAEEHQETEQYQKHTTPDEVKKGIEIMSEYDYAKLRKEFDPKGNFEPIKYNDKAFITFLVFNEFIKEFSFILSTNKIKFASVVGDINHQAKLKTLYYEINKPEENLKRYSDSSIAYNQAKREKPLSSSQYITYTKRLQEIAAKCENDGRNVRIHVKEYMEKLADGMRILSDDMNNGQAIIQNPQEIIRMETPIEGKRKLNGKKVFEAINLCYYFASAFVYRLGPGGDLSGDLEFSDEELAAIHNKSDIGSENTQKTENSILDELVNFEFDTFK